MEIVPSSNRAIQFLGQCVRRLDKSLLTSMPTKNNLRYLPSLALLHLRQYPSWSTTDEIAMAWKLQEFANGLFAFVERNGFCRHLQSLVIGMWAPPSPHRYGSIPPRHCYIRGKQRIRSGETVAIAVPVSGMTLRVLEPLSDMIDYDPGCNWLGGKVGQFRYTADHRLI